MKASIWYHPGCSKSRAALAALQARADIELEIIEYLKNPPSAAKLASLYRKAGLSPKDGLRLHGGVAEQMGLLTDGLDDEAILAAMAKEPKLIERPLVETEKGARLCRPPEKILEIL